TAQRVTGPKSRVYTDFTWHGRPSSHHTARLPDANEEELAMNDTDTSVTLDEALHALRVELGASNGRISLSHADGPPLTAAAVELQRLQRHIDQLRAGAQRGLERMPRDDEGQPNTLAGSYLAGQLDVTVQLLRFLKEMAQG